MTGHTFPKRLRVLRGSDFERVFKERASVSDAFLVLYGGENGLGHPRLGLAVSRRHGSAVVRNRWKRLLREVFRLAQQELPPLDYVCVPRQGASPDFSHLARSMPQLARRVEEKLRRRRPRPDGTAAPKRNVT